MSEIALLKGAVVGSPREPNSRRVIVNIFPHFCWQFRILGRVSHAVSQKPPSKKPPRLLALLPAIFMPAIFMPLLASLALLPAAMVRSTAVATSSNVAVAVSSKVGMAVRRRAVLTTAAGVALALPTAAANAAADDAIYRPAPGSLVGTTVLITGANTGLGLESAKRLAQAGANVVIAARTQAKADGAIAKVSSDMALAADQRLVGVSLDLADLRL